MICLLSFNLPAFHTSADNDVISEKNAFRILRQSNSQGQIALSYVFPLNSQLLSAKGFSEDEIKTYRFYLITYVNALAQTNKEKECDGVEVGNCVYFEDVDGLGFSIKFENIEVQKKFFGVENDDSNQNKENRKVSGFFVKRMELKTTFPVSSKKSAGDIKMICTMAISSWCKDNNISNERKKIVTDLLNSSVFIYDFATTEGVLKSDIMYDDENFHHNVFVKTLEEIESDNQIVFYVTSVNRPIWYLTALVVVLLGMAIAFLWVKRKKFKIIKK